MSITNEPDRVIMRGDWAGEIVLDVAWSETDNIDAFSELFDIVPGDHQAGTNYYQGMDFTSLIRRKSDGRLFGYPYWSSPGNDSMETRVDSNGEDHGFKDEYDVWVWLPVETFPITGYRIAEANQ